MAGVPVFAGQGHHSRFGFWRSTFDHRSQEITNVDIGVFQITPDSKNDPAAIAQRAEALGFESYWAADHIITPVESVDCYPGTNPGDPQPAYLPYIPDPLMMLARASAVTSTIKLGTAVCLVAERSPLLLAKQIATLDEVSGGRFVFGVGGGWDRVECAILGGDFDHRWTQIRESVAVMKGLWTVDGFAHHGRYYDFPAVRCFPRPTRTPYPPILLGSFPSERTFKRVVDYADGWLPIVFTPEDLRTHVDQIKRYADQKGRDYSEIDISVFGAMTQWRTRESVEALGKAGANRVVIWLLASDTKGALEELEALARELL